MEVNMTIVLLVGIVFFIIGGLLLTAPQLLYQFNEHIIKAIYRINDYLNKAVLKLGKYFNHLIVSDSGGIIYRYAASFFCLMIGSGCMYTYYYFSQNGTTPPIVNAFFTGFNQYISQLFCN